MLTAVNPWLQIPHQDSLLVLASDGVWEYMDNQQVADLVGCVLDRGTAGGKKGSTSRSSAGGAGDSGGGGSTTVIAKACNELVREATSRWVADYGGRYIDDITAVVVRLEQV